MSSLIVEVCTVDRVEKHPNADRMAIATIKGWRCCITRNDKSGATQFNQGDKIVYIPPDTILPLALSDRLGVTKYAAPVKDEQSGDVKGVRIRVARLRGEPSYGFPMALENAEWPVGYSVVEHYKLEKWEPPLDCTDGDAERDHPAFHKYFTLENINNFPDVIKEGEEVVMTEKIHGKNCRLGLIRDTKDDGTPIWRFMAGSHDVRRKELQTQRKRRPVYDANGMAVMETVVDQETGEEKEREVEWFYEITKRSQFFEALDKPGIKELLLYLCNGHNNVVIFAELYGSGVQDMAYGFQNGQWDVRVFDITVNGKYLDYDPKVEACNKFVVATVPLIYRGPYSRAVVDKHVGGPTTLCSPEKAGTFKEREGGVITTVKERTDNHPSKFFDRAAVKAINFAYLERQSGTEYH